MTPLEHYNNDLTQNDFIEDPAQRMAVEKLDALYHRLLQTPVVAPKPDKRAWLPWRKSTPQPITPVKGLYFWGGVGRGKTYLMDTFFHALPFENKMRMHFHRFMHRVHQELKALDGEADPLWQIADKFAQETRVLCFDEFFVSDITDAMILGTLMEALFARGITLVATSNIVPDELYRNGLQRQRFLPAIDLINQHCEVVNVDSGVDYRLRTLTQADIFHHPLGDSARAKMDDYFRKLNGEGGVRDDVIEVNHRALPTIENGDGVAHFSFAELCQSARSQTDYMELARLYHTVLLADMPQLQANQEDAARRFIALVDEFYERNVKLIISAAVPMDSLYAGERLRFEFERCQSRLIEMQSHEYLALAHLP
ncbi:MULTISPECIES: cell division protein ZapE [unclassified Salinivibrio]|uniref:cell division protein ZapE n=1 Tax=unclassified Salinivibrio TaxID=2636825 RepID=UPI000987A1D7|nr:MULTISPECIES: cell division protein ZapE [unclassified Salinivibrio]OOF15133.1 cell division protein ZapE [Salinivibrio sp. PR919]OOF18488.1 cell division protein ZapE [Salinivibrio sp. PR932]